MQIKTLIAAAIISSMTPLFAVEEYIGGWAGVSLAECKIQEYEIPVEAGPAAGILYGVALPCRFRAEVEGIYRHNRTTDIIVDGISTQLSGNIYEWSGFGNILYDLPVKWALTPYVGAGAGYKLEKADISGPGLFKVENSCSSFAAQILLGARCRCSDNWSLALTCRSALFNKDFRVAVISLGLLYNP